MDESEKMANRPAPKTWQSIPITVSGDWGTSKTDNVIAVLESVQSSFLDGIKVDSRRAPKAIHVTGDPQAECPMVLAVDIQGTNTALIRVMATNKQWARIAYQFGHELGHCLCNTWGSEAIPKTPTQWLEEALVEAFSLAGLKRMARTWMVRPPYPNWAEYAEGLASYSDSTTSEYASSEGAKLFRENGHEWIAKRQDDLSASLMLTPSAKEAVPWLVDAFAANPHLIRSMPAMNTWPERTSLSLKHFMNEWEKRCRSLGYPIILPQKIASHLL